MTLEATLTWPRLHEALREADIAAVTRMVTGASDQQRRTVRADFEAYVKTLTAELWWRVEPDPLPALAIAAAGCLPSPARVVALLNRRGLRDRWGDIPADRLIEMARSRGGSWLADLAGQLTGKLGADGSVNRWRLAAAFLSAAGQPPPTDEPFVRGWAIRTFGSWAWHGDDDVLRQALRADPYLDPLLPRLFEVDGLGAEFGTLYFKPAKDGEARVPRFVRLLVALAAEGRIDRAVLLDGCLGRFLRGDRPGALRPFIRLHDLLAPTVEELVPHATRYARLLPDAPSPVALLAQRALRQLDDAGRLEFETLLSASGQLLLRPEKGLLKTQLAWLDLLARRNPERTGEVCETVAVALGHEALDLQERALAVIGRHVERVDPATRLRLAGLTAGLTRDLAERAADLLGVPAESAAEPEPVTVPVASPTATPMPAPIENPAELAEEIVALLHGGPNPVGWERILAALVDLAAHDPTGLRDATTPILDRYGEPVFTESSWGGPSLAVYLGAALRVAVGAPGGWGPAGQRLVAAVRAAWAGTPISLTSIADPRGPITLPALRVAELSVALRRAPVPTLVATPTWTDGRLDARVLVDRLRRAEEEGWQPWRFDLTQALLRLPREADDEAARRAAELRSPAGQRLATWLTGGRPADPVSVPVEQRFQVPRGPWSYQGTPPRRVVVGLRPADAGRADDADRTDDAGGKDHAGRVDDKILDRIFRLEPLTQPPAAWAGTDTVLWSAALPNDREVVAAWLLPMFAGLADSDLAGGAELLLPLAESAGPAGLAMTLALAYSLAARRDADRVAAVDALLALAGSGALDGSALGREIGGLVVSGTLKLTRIASSLADAAGAGAAPAVWQVIEGVLPAMLAAAPRGGPDLLALGTRTAALVGARQRLPELTEVAGRPGSSRLVTEARRLERVLAG